MTDWPCFPPDAIPGGSEGGVGSGWIWSAGPDLQCSSLLARRRGARGTEGQFTGHIYAEGPRQTSPGENAVVNQNTQPIIFEGELELGRLWKERRKVQMVAKHCSHL